MKLFLATNYTPEAPSNTQTLFFNGILTIFSQFRIESVHIYYRMQLITILD